MIIDEDTYLAHFGVKGMRWGVRRRAAREARKDREATRHRSGRLTGWEVAGSIAAGYVAWSLAAAAVIRKTGNPLLATIVGGTVGISGAKFLRTQMLKQGRTRVSSLKAKKTATGVSEQEAIRKVEAFIKSNNGPVQKKGR